MNARTRRSLTLLWTALFLFSLALQSVQLATPAPALAAHLEDIFELDANAIDDPANEPDDDWNSLNHALDTFFAGAATEAAANDTTYFTGGGSKDENDVPAWAITDNSVPDKDELLDAYAAVYEKNGDTWVYFGADRFDNDGTAQIGFWFFQNDIGISNGDFTGEHVDGDVLILSEYTNGGSVSLICAYEWDGSDDGHNIAKPGNCDPATNGSNLNLVAAGVACDVADGTFDICAVSNATDKTAPWPFLNKDGETNFGPGQFFEGGINLSDMFGGNAPCFGTFLAETRSSAETDAQLKDFALGSLDTCVPPDIETHVQQSGQNVSTINKGESVVDVATFSGTNGEVTGTADFFVCHGTATTKPDCSNGGDPIGSDTLDNETATSDTFTPTLLGWYCFRVEYTPATGSEYLAGEHTNQTTECFRVIPADVQIVKSPNDGSANAGSNISFTLSWFNQGEGSAAGVVVTDTMPTTNGLDWSITGSTGTGSTCTISAADVVTCNVGTIAGNPNFPNDPPINGSVTLTSATTSANCGVINNTGQITSTNDGTDTDPGQITVLCPDINVVKTPNDGQVNAGDPASFSIVVSNAGPGAAVGASLNDPLPVGLTWALGTVTGDTDGVTCAVSPGPGAQTLSCSDSNLMDSGDSYTVTVTTTTTAAQCASYPNVATVDATNESNAASVTDDNTDPGAITVNCPDVQALKTADKSPVNAGDQIGFTVTIGNSGEGTAFGVTVSDTLDSDFSWSIESADAGWSLVGNVLSFAGNLPADSTSTVHVVAQTSIANGDQCGLVPNTAVLDHASIDPTPASASETVQCPEIDIVKGASDDLVEPNQTVTFLLDVEVVDGPVTGATITDTLPVGQTYVAGSAESKVSPAGSFSADEPTVSLDGRTLTWEFPILVTGDPSVTITYDVTIDANATSATQTNRAEICISENQLCASDDEDVTPEFPDIEIVKTAGDAADDEVFETVPGDVTYTYVVTNTGPLPLSEVTVTDDAGTPGDTSDDFTADCPQTTLAVDESMTCTFTIDVQVDTTNVAVARGVTAEGNPVEDDDDAEVVILEFGLIIDKTNDAPLEPLELPDGTIVDLPTADEGETVTYTLTYDLLGDPVTAGVITDVLPIGVTYVDESATSNDEFIFQGYDDATRTLTWTAEAVSEDGSVTYRATIDEGAAELEQPLVNVATIDSAETSPDDDDSPVFVPTIPAGATATPRVTLPPTDTLDTDTPASSNPGFALMLVLLALAAVILVLGFVTPVPASVRERSRR
jgi:uncharacterized repeat protein (TIGR01451 family)